MTEFRRGKSGEQPEILDFANYVFSQAHRPHDFKALIPKVYGEGHASEDFHFLALEDGKIRGMIASYPHDYQVLGTTLHTRFIGTVSVHPYARGGGYMKHLMADVEASNAAGGADVAFLGGQRQRYRYFGYENGGWNLRYVISDACLKHTATPDTERISLLPVEADDTELLDTLYGFYQERPVTGRSREEFFEALSTWKSRIYAVILDTDPVGYMVTSADGDAVLETQVHPASLLPDIFQNYLTWYRDGKEFSVYVRGYEKDIMEAITDMAEDVLLEDGHHMKIYNWKKVLKAFLQLQNHTGKLADGELDIEIQDTCKLKIQVQDGQIDVQEYPVTDTTIQPDWVLSATEAVRKLTTSEILYRPPVGKTAPAGWFPLNFSLTALDEF